MERENNVIAADLPDGRHASEAGAHQDGHDQVEVAGALDIPSNIILGYN
jgi:hypothetical protein